MNSLPCQNSGRLRLLCTRNPLFHNNQSLPSASVPYAISGDDASIPYTINRYLRDYQREGAKFIYDSYAHGRGCILGDDMGLGKTIQASLAAVLNVICFWGENCHWYLPCKVHWIDFSSMWLKITDLMFTDYSFLKFFISNLFFFFFTTTTGNRVPGCGTL